MQEHDHDEDDYRGPAAVCTEQREVAAEVVLRGNFQPIDGRFHWYGRVLANPEIDDLADGKKTRVVVRTPDGAAAGTLSEPDPWGRYRLNGVGKPPFLLEEGFDLQLDDAPAPARTDTETVDGQPDSSA